MATEGGGEVGGVKLTTILIVVLVLWFISKQVGAATGAINRAAGSADRLSKPATDIGGAISGFINAGSAAIGSWLKGSGGSARSSTSTSRAPGTSSTWTGDGLIPPSFDDGGTMPSAWTDDTPASDGNLYV